MKIRYFARLPLLLPEFAQDHPTFIMLGRWCHMHVPHYGEWFIVNPAPPDPYLLNRPTTKMREITRDTMLGACGPRLKFEEFEDRIGIRFKPLAKWITKWIPFTKKIRMLKWIATLDEDDNEEWWRERQQPQIGVAFGPKEGVFTPGLCSPGFEHSCSQDEPEGKPVPDPGSG